MLVKATLESDIKNALDKAMKAAFEAALKAISGATDDDNKKSVDDVAKAFADEAQKCAGDIATAIDNYIKSATITLNVGTLMTPMPTLVSPAGPVTGAITLAAPTVLSNSIS